MKLSIQEHNIPGTIIARAASDGLWGMAFLDRVFFLSDGVMLSQIRDISGVDGSTLQNWVKRGWVPNPTKKTYDKEQLARILLICMMRDTMQLSRVAFVLQYINGTDEEDRIIRESELYDIVCRVMTELTADSFCTQTGQTVPISRLLYSQVRQAYIDDLFAEAETAP